MYSKYKGCQYRTKHEGTVVLAFKEAVFSWYSCDPMHVFEAILSLNYTLSIDSHSVSFFLVDINKGFFFFLFLRALEIIIGNVSSMVQELSSIHRLCHLIF